MHIVYSFYHLNVCIVAQSIDSISVEDIPATTLSMNFFDRLRSGSVYCQMQNDLKVPF